MAVGKLAIVELTVSDNGPFNLFKDFRLVNLPKSSYRTRDKSGSHDTEVANSMKQNLHNRLFFFLTLLTFSILRSDNISAQFQPPSNTENKATEEFAKNATSILKGRVIWDKQDLTGTTVQVYKDKNLKELYTIGILKNNQFQIRVGAGNYYLVAFVDTDHSSKFDAGDGMGIYGITDLNASDQQKQIVKIADRQTISRLEIIITARMQTVDGQNKIIPIQDYRADPVL